MHRKRDTGQKVNPVGFSHSKNVNNEAIKGSSWHIFLTALDWTFWGNKFFGNMFFETCELYCLMIWGCSCPETSTPA